jgi:murein DD-endopeptidase MepM/ murein hydrolase activator NlpD
MDFKTPIGTPVRLPRAGRVERLNWDAEANGLCVEVRYTDGMLARFLHLNEIEVKLGQTLAAGTEIGKSGNTGRSVAAHLHYELEKGGRIVDPVSYHGTLQRSVQPDALPRFKQEAGVLSAQLDGQVAAR